MTPCQPHRGYINPNGYGVVRGRLAHRTAWEALNGPIPDGLELDHLCRNRECVNPEHLEPVTRQENVRRTDRYRNGVCPRGHAYDSTKPAKTTVSGRARRCLTCHREAQARYAARVRTASQPATEK